MNHGDRRELQLISTPDRFGGTILNVRPYTYGVDNVTPLRADLERMRDGWDRVGMSNLSIVDVPARRLRIK